MTRPTTTLTAAELPLTYRRARVVASLDIRTATSVRVDGFTVEAFDGFIDAHVFETDDGWVGAFYGDPAKRNPWVNGTRSCLCPVVTLDPVASRTDAARAAIVARAAERNPKTTGYRLPLVGPLRQDETF